MLDEGKVWLGWHLGTSISIKLFGPIRQCHVVAEMDGTLVSSLSHGQVD